jgi:hypothetical protein
MDVEVNPSRVVSYGEAVRDDEVVFCLEALEETIFAAGVDYLCPFVWVCFVPDPAFEMMKRKGRQACFVEPCWVAYDI